MTIGVAISTHNRRYLLEESLAAWCKFRPPNSVLVVVDDASDHPFIHPFDDIIVIRHRWRLGVAMTKNTGIAALMDAGCDHLFLADDDVYPKCDEWWQPYLDSLEPHLSYQWPKIRPSSNKWRLVHDDGDHFSIGFPRGVLLYAERRVIETVGGMDPAHGAWGGEHVDFSHRIYEAGLTSWPYADVCGSRKLWYAHDRERGNTVGSTFSLKDRREMARLNGAQWCKHKDLFVPYRWGEGKTDYGLGPDLSNEHRPKPTDTLNHVLRMRPSGTAMEFGVGEGNTLRLIAAQMPLIGFDSFQGLPQDWRPGFPKGRFACPPPVVPNARIAEGWFEDTLPNFDWPEYIGLVHFDADLYSSTATALRYIGPRLLPGCYIVFDEWWGYEGHQDHEMKAWCEYAESTRIGWTVIGHGVEQWAIRLT